MSSAEQKVYYTEEDYYNLPEDVYAELIDGEIYYKAAPSIKHQDISGGLYATIYNSIVEKNGSCKVFHAPVDVKLSDNPTTIVQPDLMVICDKDKLDGKRCNGAPDWIIEIVSPGNFNHDYIKKLNLYESAGVREYWIVDPMTEKVIAYHLEEPEYINTYTFQDKIKVGIFDDLEIDLYETFRLLLPDDTATPDGLEQIKAVLEEYKRDETISRNNIDWN